MPKPTPEADLIESAYADLVKVLYKTLFNSLQDGGSNPSPGAEQQCLEHFSTGLKLARRARELALKASTAPSVSLIAMAVTSPEKKTKS